jgi:methionine-rich copper-binding protein CopC
MSSIRRPTRPPSVVGLAPTALLTSLLIAGLTVLGGATAAQAHNVLRSTDPVDGSTVAVAPDQVTLTFDEPAIALGTQVEVRRPDGTIVSVGEPVLTGASVSQTLAGDRPAGTYTVEWRVTSDDGHPITGGLTFTATGATTTEGAAPSATPGDQITSTEAPSNPAPTDLTTPSAVATPSSSAGPAGDAGNGSSAPVVVAVVIAAAALSWLLWRRRRPRNEPEQP